MKDIPFKEANFSTLSILMRLFGASVMTIMLTKNILKII